MKRILNAVLILVAACVFSGCNLFNDPSNYTKTTATFTDALLNNDYNKCIRMMNIDSSSKSVNIIVAKMGLDSLRDKVSGHFGNKLEYSFMSAQHEVSDDAYYGLPPNTTLVSIEFNNNVDVGVMQVLFNNSTGKIVNIKSLSVKEPIPNMTLFWLFGLLAVAVLAFNFYVFVLVVRSKLKLKWLYLVAIVLANVPSVEYHAVKGFEIKLYTVQYLMGVYFQKVNYLGSVWEVGLPIGALFAWWMIKFFPAASQGTQPVQAPSAKSTSKLKGVNKK